jgi:hypothetical protein
MIDDRIDRLERFYHLKLKKGLAHDDAMLKVERKFSPTRYELRMLDQRIAGKPKGDQT